MRVSTLPECKSATFLVRLIGRMARGIELWHGHGMDGSREEAPAPSVPASMLRRYILCTASGTAQLLDPYHPTGTDVICQARLGFSLLNQGSSPDEPASLSPLCSRGIYCWQAIRVSLWRWPLLPDRGRAVRNPIGRDVLSTLSTLR